MGIRIFVKGIYVKRHWVIIRDYDGITGLKEFLEFITLIPSFDQKLIYLGKQLEEPALLCDYRICKEAQ